MNRGMNKQNVVYTRNEILFSLKKELNSDTTWMRHYANQNKSYTKGKILYDSTYIKYLEQANS